MRLAMLGRFLVLGALAAAAMAMLVASGARTGSAAEAVALEFPRSAPLVMHGSQIQLRYSVTCPAGYSVLEAFVYITQDGRQTFGFTRLPVECTGGVVRGRVRLDVDPESPIRPGDAFVSAFVLLLDPSGTGTLSVSPFEPIVIR